MSDSIKISPAGYSYGMDPLSDNPFWGASPAPSPGGGGISIAHGVPLDEGSAIKLLGCMFFLWIKENIPFDDNEGGSIAAGLYPIGFLSEFTDMFVNEFIACHLDKASIIGMPDIATPAACEIIINMLPSDSNPEAIYFNTMSIVYYKEENTNVSISIDMLSNTSWEIISIG